MFFLRGRANIIMDGQFGSTGKGLIAGYLGLKDERCGAVDFAVTNAAPNAGHTFVQEDGRKIMTHHFPMVGLVNPETKLVIDAGAIIDPVLFQKEMKEFNIHPGRVYVHPRAAVICPEDVEEERRRDSGPTKIASTQHGVGAALKRKIDRTAILAKDHPYLSQFCYSYPNLNQTMRDGATVSLEVPQGYGLGINSGLSYPHCTSREISVSQALSDAQIHPRYLGNVLMSIRTYPIRVGNIKDYDGKEIGWSGPFWEDSMETTWERLGFKPELTTVTKRVRRVATFSFSQYEDALEALRPTHVFVNFMNYLKSWQEAKDFLTLLVDKEIDHNQFPIRYYYGCGPTVKDVLGDPGALEQYYKDVDDLRSVYSQSQGVTE